MIQNLIAHPLLRLSKGENNVTQVGYIGIYLVLLCQFNCHGCPQRILGTVGRGPTQPYLERWLLLVEKECQSSNACLHSCLAICSGSLRRVYFEARFTVWSGISFQVRDWLSGLH